MPLEVPLVRVVRVVREVKGIGKRVFMTQVRSRRVQKTWYDLGNYCLHILRCVYLSKICMVNPLPSDGLDLQLSRRLTRMITLNDPRTMILGNRQLGKWHGPAAEDHHIQ